MFESEESFVQRFIDLLRQANAPWGPVRVAREFDYSRGRTDVVAVTDCGQVLAFEAKLSRWRVALHQAYRNLCFAHKSFVLLPKKMAVLASRFEVEFQRRNVGLCYIDDTGDVVLLVSPTPGTPLQPWLSDRATVSASGDALGVSV